MILKDIRLVMYHYVRDLKHGRYNNIKGLDVEQFKYQLEFLKNNFTIIKAEDLINDICELPSPIRKYNPDFTSKPPLLLTFDDGYIDHYNVVFPILNNMGLQGSFFISAQVFCENKLLDVNKIHFVLASADIDNLYNDVINQIKYYSKEGWELPPVEKLIEKYAIANRFDNAKTVFVKRILQTALPEKLRGIIASNLFEKYINLPEDVFARELYLNKDQIKCMKNNGMFIGLHGYNHYWLGNLSKEEQTNEIDKALLNMEEFIDKNCWIMNYPYGSYNKDTIEIIKQRGCVAAFSTVVDIYNPQKYGRYEIPRLDTVDFPPRSENYKNFEKTAV